VTNGKAAGTKRRIDRDKLVEAAVELLTEAGLDGLSTRNLAAKLGVRQPALYWHLRNKEELLDLVAEAICADFADFSYDERAGWRENIHAGMTRFRELLLNVRDSAKLLARRTPTGPNRLRLAETTITLLLDAGFTKQDAAVLSVVLTDFVIGAVSAQYAAGQDVDEFTGNVAAMLTGYPNLASVLEHFSDMDPDVQFETGLQIFLDGMERRLERLAMP
jgi:TetR/AcrR family tetracycline transcriptional repressor